MIYVSRSAFRISFFAAVRAGKIPPMAPRKTANPTPIAMMGGVTWKLNEVSLNVTKFPSPVEMLFSGSTRMQPMIPPMADSSSDSRKKLVRMLPREKPSTRKVPTSRARRATLAYIVFIAAKQLPTAMMIATNVPKN
jgi:hypothetical protein